MSLFETIQREVLFIGVLRIPNQVGLVEST